MKQTKQLVQGAVIAALYAVLTYAFAPFSFGPMQFRVSEALTALPLLMQSAVPGLAIGCIVANLVGGYGIYDIVIGSFATLLGALGTRALRKKPILAMLCPVISNAILVGSMLYFIVPDSGVLWMNMLTVGAGELGVCFGLGLPLYCLLKKRPSLWEG